MILWCCCLGIRGYCRLCLGIKVIFGGHRAWVSRLGSLYWMDHVLAVEHSYEYVMFSIVSIVLIL